VSSIIFSFFMMAEFSECSGKAIVASALAINEKVVRIAFFRIKEAEKTDGMASTSRRR